MSYKIKCIILIYFLIIISGSALSQNTIINKENRKGKLYFYWGWNRDWYSSSDIKFKGDDYAFELKNVKANDKQSDVSFDNFLNPANATIPQYNFRIGYFIKDNWDLSFGIDHMKYVVETNQRTRISGRIENSQTIYDGIYTNDNIILTEDFLQFEHTDGLNYLNIELRRFDKIIDLNKIALNLTEGFGLGALLPRTDTTLLNNERHDKFHLSGFGVNAVFGVNISFFEIFFIQSEFKGGYINLPDIRTTQSRSDKANQDFFFTQLNIVFGALINLNTKH